MKRLFTGIITLILLLSLLPMLGAQAVSLNNSGDLDSPKPTKTQIQEKWAQVTDATTLFDTEPSVSAPYKTGKLSDDFLESGITFLNYVRYVANLPQVQLNDQLNLSAQYGAVLLAANDEFSHYPSKPDDMSLEFYVAGYAATTTSNLSARYGYAAFDSLKDATCGCMDDNSSQSNLACVGHRRWLLNPTLLNVGFGYAQSDSGWHYITTKVFDSSGSGCDYDYISWPSSGNFPTNLFHLENPWSVTLNPQKYLTPVLKNIKITITRQADGKTWSFDSSTGKPSTSENAYLTVENSYYGIPNCIIFHPGSKNIDQYNGVYQVDISGLYTRDGKKTELHYQVDFFDVEANYKEKATISKQPASVAVANGKTATVKLTATGDGLTYKWYFKDKTGKSFALTNSFKGSTYSISMNAARNGRQVYCVVTDKYGNSVKSNVVTLSMKTVAKITKQPVSVTVASGKTASVKVTATGDGLTYKWYFKDKTGKSFALTNSFKGSTYSIAMNGSRNGRQVYCVVTDKYGNSVKSNVVTLSMKTVAKITKQPASVAVTSGKTASVKVTATGDGLTYKWYFKDKTGKSFALTNSFKDNTYSIAMSSSRNGRQVYCVVTDKYGNSVKSNVVTLKLKTTAKITKQPASVAVASGKTATVKLTAVGDGLTYKWYVKDKGAKKFTLSSSFKGSSYSLAMNSSRNGRQVYCVITDKYGNSVKSNVVTLSIKTTAKITVQPVSMAATSGKTATVKITATGDGLTYKWYFKDKGSKKFTLTNSFKGNTYSLSMNSSRNGRQVYCVVTDKYGNSVKSDTVTLNLTTISNVITNPVNVTVKKGATVKITANVSGTNLTYKWQVKTSGTWKNATVTGSKTKAITFLVTAADAGRQYRCIVTDKYGNSVASGVITLIVK